MPRYEILNIRDRVAYGDQEAESERDALALYSMSFGYADPRELDDEYEFFQIHPDGTLSMIFENVELIAVQS